MTTINNPYQPEEGYEDFNNIPIVGYGITLDTIRYWLVEHHLSAEMTKLKQNANLDEDDIDELQATVFHNSNNIEYVQGGNIEFEALMQYASNYQNQSQTIPSTADIVMDIVNVSINQLFDIPESLIESFTQFVYEYAGAIYTTDFD